MEQFLTIIFFIVLVSVIIAILSLRYTIRLRKYLAEFTYVSKKISNKEFHTRLNISAKGELGELAKNFNEMIVIMDKTIAEVEYTILSSLLNLSNSIPLSVSITDSAPKEILFNCSMLSFINTPPSDCLILLF